MGHQYLAVRPRSRLLFFLIGVFRSHLNERRVLRFLPVVIALCYAWATVLTLVPLLGRGFWYLPTLLQLGMGVVPVAAVLGYQLGRRSSAWVDSGYAWIGTLLVLSFLFGCWVVRLTWFDAGPPLLGGFGVAQPTAWRVDTRAGTFMINGLSLIDQEFRPPLFDLIGDGLSFLAVLVVASLACLVFRVRNRARGLQIALIVQPTLLHRGVPEGTVCLAAALALAYTADQHLARESRRSGVWRRLAITIGLVAAVYVVSNLIVCKFVALTRPDQWDIVCIAYGTIGLVFGRCVALWDMADPPVRRSQLSVDKKIVNHWNIAPSAARRGIRIDTVIFLVPPLVLGLAAVLAAQVRGVRLPAEGLYGVLWLTAGTGLVLAACQFLCWRRTCRNVPITRERMALMRLFSAMARRPAAVGPYEAFALILLPVVVPSAVVLHFGPRIAPGLVATGLTLVAAAVVGWLALAVVRSRPPTVLVLGASNANSFRLHGLVSDAVSPLRAVSLLHLTQAANTGPVPPRSDCLRTIWSNDWHQVLLGLIELAPVVVLDGRAVTEATKRELHTLHDERRLERTVLVSADNGSVPLLLWWQGQRGFPLEKTEFATVVPESEVGSAVRATIEQCEVAGRNAPALSSPLAHVAANRVGIGMGLAGPPVREGALRVGKAAIEFGAQVPGCLFLVVLLSPCVIGPLIYFGAVRLPASWDLPGWAYPDRRSRFTPDKLDPAVTPDPEPGSMRCEPS